MRTNLTRVFKDDGIVNCSDDSPAVRWEEYYVTTMGDGDYNA
ncbi:MAG TPA: hypothetical protein VK818_02045 [Methylomirabilota bacterium]|nr:hypothetical protein [Methylomirabilota bacterium]